MPLNPLVFDSEEDFKKALFENGKKNGWIPIVKDFAHSVIQYVLSQNGNKKVSELK